MSFITYLPRSLSCALPRLSFPSRFSHKQFHSSSLRQSGHSLVQHKDTPDNTAETPFDFTPENYKKIEQILKKYPANYKQSGVMPLLTLAQEQNGNFLSLSAMNKVAEILNVPNIRVYETATFYTMYNRTKVGKYHIQLCGTTPCMLCGAENIAQTIEKHLGIKMGETTSDGMFTLTEVECLGACANAPMIQINNHEFYENLDEKSTIALVEELRSGRKPKVGPQNGQRVAEGPLGKTSLFADVNKPQYECRDFDALKRQLEETKKEAAAKAAEAQKEAKSAATTANKVT